MYCWYFWTIIKEDMSIDNNRIVNALRRVKDPKTGLDVISLKMIKDLKIDGMNVSFSLSTSESSPEIKASINFACQQAITEEYPEAQVHVHMEQKTAPPTTQAGSVLPQIKNVIAIASGKGGVGKSTVTTNLAIELIKQGATVGIMDADLYGPSIPTMLGTTAQRPKVQKLYGQNKIVPIEAHGIHMISIGNIIEPEQAVVLRGPRLGGIIKQFVNECLWPELDFLLIDLPPGTGDIQLTLVQTLPLTGAIMVTTPQEVAIVDAVKAMNMFLLPNINVPILGVVENMSWFTPAELPDNKYHIFGQGGGMSLAKKANTMMLGQIPLVQGIREAGDEGNPITNKQSSEITASYFENICKNFIQQVNVRNNEIAPTKIVEITN